MLRRSHRDEADDRGERRQHAQDGSVECRSEEDGDSEVDEECALEPSGESDGEERRDDTEEGEQSTDERAVLAPPGMNCIATV